MQIQIKPHLFDQPPIINIIRMSEMFSGSFQGSQMDAEEDKPMYIYGMYFCGSCKNIMTPSKQQGEKLEFDCKQCAKKQVDFTNFKDDECIIYNKELKPGSRKEVASKEFINDPTMPRVEVECPECGCEEAIYLITPDEGQTCLEIKLICANVIRGRCDNLWVLNNSEILFKDKMITQEELQGDAK